MDTETGNKKESGIVIVTGSNGTIGDAVMRRFAGRFDDVVGFDRKAPNPPPGRTAVAVDITSEHVGRTLHDPRTPRGARCLGDSSRRLLRFLGRAE